MEKDTKECPFCGSEIKAVAKKCRYCGEWLDGRSPAAEQTCPPDDDPQDTLVENERDDEVERECENNVNGQGSINPVIIWVAIIAVGTLAILLVAMWKPDKQEYNTNYVIEEVSEEPVTAVTGEDYPAAEEVTVDNSASERYQKKYDEVRMADIRLMRADGKKIWYSYRTESGGYDEELWIYDSETDNVTVVNLNKTSQDEFYVADMVERNGIITIIMDEIRNSNGWIEGTYVWQYNCDTGGWRALAEACSGAEFVNNRTAVRIDRADIINPDDPTYLQQYSHNYTIINL